jgi:hypothetical protein
VFRVDVTLDHTVALKRRTVGIQNEGGDMGQTFHAKSRSTRYIPSHRRYGFSLTHRKLEVINILHGDFNNTNICYLAVHDPILCKPCFD